MQKNGKFVISLDLELFWGVRDKRTIKGYGDSIKKVHEITPHMVKMFEEYGIKATWATVGFLFAKDKNEMIHFSPKEKPKYENQNLSPYSDNFQLVKNSLEEDPYHFGNDLIEELFKNPNQEIASHTFSHYYCLEEGQTFDEFQKDIEAAVKIAESKEIKLTSLVFPRNQTNKKYLDVCVKNGIHTYRGNENVWYKDTDRSRGILLIKKIFRTGDCYLNVSGHHCYNLDDLPTSAPFNVPSSRFLRPYIAKGGILLESLKLRRIKKSMTHAAKRGMLYHLWWHPHNFGANTKVNFRTLEKILNHYIKLNKKYGFESSTMTEISNICAGTP
ncbi:polysaccharide deacetylase family protein [Flagellimonas sp. CMM7]|uniref:polysaccharide deacetylase family protein n=1 Tax=Flagellimonas sp. CMM7 TaxID=2654676 RepID=UPI001F424147|nr:polysaccharide deacetylase family protein [Flagellimonas sp. CMM7]UII79920.1 polysaccharide deacetylase family protein [Flagellimonas sp. CMM7]